MESGSFISCNQVDLYNVFKSYVKYICMVQAIAVKISVDYCGSCFRCTTMKNFKVYM